MNEPTPNCPACTSTVPGYHHTLECPHLTLEHAIWWAGKHKHIYSLVCQRWRDQTAVAQRWEGKFRVVKHENNQLRRKLGARYPATPSAPGYAEFSFGETCARRDGPSDLHQTTP